MKTRSTKLADIERRWLVIDATDRVLGRLASEIAQLLEGKGKPGYTPHLDCGDYVVVVNASRVSVSGEKGEKKTYYSHSQYPGGLKRRSLRTFLAEDPAGVVKHAVEGMLPHNRLGRLMLRKLRVYPGPEHPHQAQVEGAQQRSERPEEGKA